MDNLTTTYYKHVDRRHTDGIFAYSILRSQPDTLLPDMQSNINPPIAPFPLPAVRINVFFVNYYNKPRMLFTHFIYLTLQTHTYGITTFCCMKLLIKL